MGVSLHAMVYVTCFAGRVDVHPHPGDVWHVVDDPVSHFLGDRVTLPNRQVHPDRHVELDGHPVADPPCARIGYLEDSRDVASRVFDGLERPRIHTVQHPHEDLASRLPHETEDREGDDQADDRVGQGISHPQPGCADQHRQTREPVSPGVISIRDERHAALPSRQLAILDQPMSGVSSGSSSPQVDPRSPERRSPLAMFGAFALVEIEATTRVRFEQFLLMCSDTFVEVWIQERIRIHGCSPSSRSFRRHFHRARSTMTLTGRPLEWMVTPYSVSPLRMRDVHWPDELFRVTPRPFGATTPESLPEPPRR
jgi:hypothetical protein